MHDFAYSDTAFDGYQPPSILQVPGAKDVAVELYTLTKSFSMAGLAGGLHGGKRGDGGSPHQAQELPGLRDLPAHPDRCHRDPQRSARLSRRWSTRSTSPAATPCCDGLSRIGWEVERPKGTMFVWAPIPEPYREMGSLEFAKHLVTEAEVATSPGVGFGRGGEGFVRFALIENEQRIQQGVRNLRRVLTKLD